MSPSHTPVSGKPGEKTRRQTNRALAFSSSGISMRKSSARRLPNLSGGALWVAVADGEAVDAAQPVAGHVEDEFVLLAGHLVAARDEFVED
jgi:hypothetical protein